MVRRRSRLVLALLAAAVCACSESEPSDPGGAGSPSGSGGAGAAGGAAPEGGAGPGGATGAGGTACAGGAGGGGPSGATVEVSPGGALADALATAKPGDQVVVHAGSYPHEDLQVDFAADVWIVAAPGEEPTFAGLTFTKSNHVVLRGLAFDDTLKLDACGHFRLEEISIDVGTLDASGLHIHGQGDGGPSHDIEVVGSKIHGGARTVFILGKFAPSDGWNHDLWFHDDDFACGSHNCFQLSGARDTVIADSLFHDPVGGGVLTAGATRIQVLRNRMEGGAAGGTAIQIATPGAQWDNYNGVENMISSEITVANNLIHSWGGNAIQLDACHDVDIVFNTVADMAGLRTNRRVPVDTSGNTILIGNEQIRLWNEILTSISIDDGDPRPVFESNNLVAMGGDGDGLLTSDPGFADTTSYALGPSSPAVDSGVVDPDNPADDLLQNVRDPKPDRGAIELGAEPPACR